MAEWWGNLTVLNQTFYGIAAFFSVFFIWQLLAALVGLGGGEGEAEFEGAEDAGDIDDIDTDATYEDFEQGAEADAVETIAAFKILSLRSIVAFFTLFSWGMALYLNNELTVVRALSYSIIWGFAGMFCVALVFYLFRKMTASGTMSLNTAIGRPGTVYLDIAEDGTGEVRITVSDRISYVKARGMGGTALKAGTPIRVVRRVDQTTVEVKPIDEKKEEKKEE
jgi:hypothetical protein